MNDRIDDNAIGDTATGRQITSRSPRGPLLIYGAYGRTGRMVAKAALRRGREVLLAGANRQCLHEIALELDAPAARADLGVPLALRQLVRKASAVLNVAGPFVATWRPMVEACAAEQVPYLDLNGELDVFRAMEDFVRERKPDIPVVPGVGFGVAAGESAALDAANRIDSPQQIVVGLAPDLGQRSRGALISTFRIIAKGGFVVRGGAFVPERVGRRSYGANTEKIRETMVSMPLGELWAVQRSTGAKDVVAGAAMPAMERMLLQSGILGLMVRSERMQKLLAQVLAQEEKAGDKSAYKSIVCASATGRDGRVAKTILTMGEGYSWSAEFAVSAAEAVLHAPRVGLWSPGQYFGHQLALSVPGTDITRI